MNLTTKTTCLVIAIMLIPTISFAGNYQQLASTLRYYDIAPQKVKWHHINQRCSGFRGNRSNFQKCQIQEARRNAYLKQEREICHAEARLTYPDHLRRNQHIRLIRHNVYGTTQRHLQRQITGKELRQLRREYVKQCTLSAHAASQRLQLAWQ